jgi:hypothetical protein
MDGFDDVWLEKREIVETKLKYIHNNPLQPHWALAEKLGDLPLFKCWVLLFRTEE